MTTPLLIEHENGITTLTLNRPEIRNAISSPEMIDAITAAMTAADQDLGVRVVILTGAGSAFSSGGDVSSMRPGNGLVDLNPAVTRHFYRKGIQRLPRMFESIEVPVIAAVNGPAIGAGCDLATMCDIRVASVKARFAESFVKLGIVPGDGGAWLLPRVVGYSKACELAFTGDVLDAQAALACGLVSQVVEHEELLAAAQQLARRIAANSTQAVRMTKRLLREARLASLSAILEMSANAQSIAHSTPEHTAAVTAYMEKKGASQRS
jgi:enoyl-CoA hydratase/carnithine racemase